MAVNKIQILIDDFAFETEEVIKDVNDGYEWFKAFRETLIYKGRKANPLPYAAECLLEAEGFNAGQTLNKMKGYVKSELAKSGQQNPTDEEIEKGMSKKYGKEYQKAKKSIQLKEKIERIREIRALHNMEKSLGIEESNETTAGAPNGNNGEESATACENMRRVPQNEDPSHGFSGGDRPAQGSMSLPPSGAAHDGNNLGSAKATTPVSTPTISTDGPRQAENAQAEAGAPSHGGSVANNFAQALDSLSDKASDQEASNTGNAQPVAFLESGKFEVTTKKPLAGGLPPSSSLKPSASSGAVDVLNLAYSGEFGNVKLTQEQYSELGIKFGNMQKLNRAIDSLSCKLENDEIKPAPKNHYALLLKWASYREDMEEKKELEESKPKMTNMEKSWIAAMKRVEAM